MKRILVVDDEPDILNMLTDILTVQGYDVVQASGGEAALALVHTALDLVLLDVNMPDMDGLAVCRAIRPHISCPILFLTAKVTDRDKILGFQAGGDDYILKPFSMAELIARVTAHLRREERRQTTAQVRFAGGLMIDYKARGAYWDGKPVPLARKEFDILELLTLHPGQVFDKERIYEAIWGYDSEGDSAVVAEHIRRLRIKLAATGLKPQIETVWGVGYKWKT